MQEVYREHCALCGEVVTYDMSAVRMRSGRVYHTTCVIEFRAANEGRLPPPPGRKPSKSDPNV
jgi:hypothetical protein